MPDPTRSRAVRFDAFTLDQSQCVLLRDGQTLTLRPKSFDVLSYLVEHAGRHVSQKELLQEVWTGLTVTPDSVVQCIKEIRHIVGDNDHQLIKTFPRRGYVFTGTVCPVLSPDDAVATASRSVPSRIVPAISGLRLISAAFVISALAFTGWTLRDRLQVESSPSPLTMMAVPSIAVLPFKKLGNERLQAGAADAFVEDIRTELSRAPGAFMTAPKFAPAHRQVRDPKAAGRELGVRYVVLGSTRGDADMLHVNVQLIEAETGRQLWAEALKFAPEGQNSAVARLARILGVQLISAESRRPLPPKPEAGHFAILGRAVLNNERGNKANQQAQLLYKKALALDPDWTPALLGYARTKVDSVFNGWAPRDEHVPLLDEAEIAVERAITLDPRLMGAHHLRGSVLRARGEPERAIAAFEYALTLSPNFAPSRAELGRSMIEVGRADETIGEIETAIRLSPTDPILFIWCYWAGQAALHVGQDEAAVQWLLKARQANRVVDNPMPWLAVAYSRLGRWAEGRALIAEYLAKFPQFTIATWYQDFPRRNRILAEQREWIADTLEQLGVPKDNLRAGVAQ